MGGVFLNYRIRDSATPCAFIRDTLARRFGAELVFRDCDSMQAGERYPDELRTALADADVVVTIIGPDWLTLTDDTGIRMLDRERDWVRYEIHYALEHGIPIIPVLLSPAHQHTAAPAPADLPVELAELTNRQMLSISVDRLGADLDTLIARLIAVAPTLVIPGLFTQPPPARTEANAPSVLLRPEYEIVPMSGHTRPMADLRSWVLDSTGCSARLLIGPPGAGKTRVATQLCAEMRARGWLAGVVHGEAPAAEIGHTAAIDKPLLVVVDDVETRAGQLMALAAAVADRAQQRDSPTRLLLLAPSAGDWLLPFRRHDATRVSTLFRGLTADSAVRVGLDAADRQVQFEQAQYAFAAALRQPNPPVWLTDAAWAAESLVDLHAAALVAVLTATNRTTIVDDHVAPVARLIGLECRRLRRMVFADGGDLDLAGLAELGTLGTLCQPGSAAEADALRDRLPALLGNVTYSIDEHLGYLRMLYPGPYSINAVRPDLLGEQLIAATLGVRPGLAAEIARHGTSDQIAQAMIVIGRALDRHPGLATPLTELIRVDVNRLLPICGEVACRLAEPTRFVRVFSDMIDATKLPVDGIGQLFADAQQQGTSTNPTRAAALAQFIETFTAPIRNAPGGSSPGLDRFTNGLTSAVLGSLDPNRGGDNQQIVPQEWLGALWRALIDGDGKRP